MKRKIKLTNLGFLDRLLWIVLEGLTIILDIVNQFECRVLSGVVIKNLYVLIALKAFVCELFMKTI